MRRSKDESISRSGDTTSGLSSPLGTGREEKDSSRSSCARWCSHGTSPRTSTESDRTPRFFMELSPFNGYMHMSLTTNLREMPLTFRTDTDRTDNPVQQGFIALCHSVSCPDSRLLGYRCFKMLFFLVIALVRRQECNKSSNLNYPTQADIKSHS